MAKGESGRIVIEVDPALKRELYAVLAISGRTLKDWFVHSAAEYCSSEIQGSLFTELRSRPATGSDQHSAEPCTVAIKTQIKSSE